MSDRKVQQVWSTKLMVLVIYPSLPVICRGRHPAGSNPRSCLDLPRRKPRTFNLQPSPPRALLQKDLASARSTRSVNSLDASKLGMASSL